MPSKSPPTKAPQRLPNTITESQLLKNGVDPAIIPRLLEEERERQARRAERLRAEQPLVRALREVGVHEVVIQAPFREPPRPLESVWDLVNTGMPYPEAIPILLEHFRKPYPEVVREGIGRALAVREARPFWKELLELFRDEPDSSGEAKWALACALAGAADDSVFDDVAAIVRDPRYGTHRMAFLLLLGSRRRCKDPRAEALLEEACRDPQLAKEAPVQLKKRRRMR